MKKILSIAVFSMIIISSCQKEDEVTPLLATVDSEISAQIGAAVILDGSASDGLDRAEVQWIYNGGPVDEGAITYDNDGNMVFDQSSITTSFMPTKTGQYQFILRLTEGGEYSEAYVTITVSGSLELTELNTSTTLEDINNSAGFGSEADYIVNTVITIPQDVAINLASGVTIDFGSEGGIIVEGYLTGVTNGNQIFEASGTSAWKGIWVKSGGSFSVPYFSIYDAGSSSLSDNAAEAAALLIDGNASIGYASIENSAAYAIYIGANGSFTYESGFYFKNNTNTLRMPYHLLENGKFRLQNLSLSEEPATARIELYGVEGYTLRSATQIINISRPIYVESDIEFNSAYTEVFYIANAELRFASGTGLIINGKSVLENATLIGQTETAGSWKGVYLGGQDKAHIIMSSTIKHGGGDTYATANGPAGIYLSRDVAGGYLQLTSSTISDNIGIGLIADGQLSSLSSNSFSNNTLAHVRMNISELNRIAVNTFSSDVPTIELQKLYGGIVNGLKWKSLGSGNYYLCKTNLVANSITLEAGLHVKFDINKYMDVAGQFTVEGTANEPVVLEGTTDTPGDWVGLRFSANAAVDYLTIKHGGRTGGEALFGTQNTANLFMQSVVGRTVSITNSTFSSGAGLGVVVKTGTSRFNVTEAASNNSMSGATGGFFDEN